MNIPEHSPVLDDELDGLFAPLAVHSQIALGVSGGADSMALMHLAARWRDLTGGEKIRLIVLTVDHGIRAESRTEAQWVFEQARSLALDPFILTWIGEKPRSGIQEAARAARYELMIKAAKHEKCTALVVAHHLEDQAETLLMRLARGSGIDGLAGMAPVVARSGIQLYRPFLGLSKWRLRSTLSAMRKVWLEDPSNENRVFERVRVREVSEVLAPLGIVPVALARSAQRLGRARQALKELTRHAIASSVDFHGGAFGGIDVQKFMAQPEEIRLRVLSAVVEAFGGRRRPPRMARLETVLYAVDRAFAQNTSCSTSLGGALVRYDGRDIKIFREPLRGDIGGLRVEPGGAPVIWDGRFEISAHETAPVGLSVSALGEKGIKDINELGWTTQDMPREVLLGLPGLRLDGQIIIAPQFMEVANFSKKGIANLSDYPVGLRFLEPEMCQTGTKN